MPQLGGDRVADPTCIGVRSAWPAIAVTDDFQRTLDPQNRLCRPLRWFSYFELIVGFPRSTSDSPGNRKIAPPRASSRHR